MLKIKRNIVVTQKTIGNIIIKMVSHKGSFTNHKKEGYWEEYGYNGLPCYKGNYNNNKEHGYVEWKDNHHTIAKYFHLS